jgi:protein tyrosine phosphatase (PTP) superfamily phosphohydrolase (DUF442 family)
MSSRRILPFLLAGLWAMPAALAQPPARGASGTASEAPPRAAALAAEKLRTVGLPNLGRISQNLYRGGQPEKGGYAELKKLGVEIVINFRETEKAEKEERARVEALGMQYVEIPWSGFDDPGNKDVAKFLQMIKDNSGKKIFFHCRRGAERTGVMGATYRMAFEGWTPEQTLDEMEQFKFRGLWFRHLKKYVRSFPQQLESDPILQPFKPK